MTVLIIVKQITLVGCIDWNQDLQYMSVEEEITVLSYTKALVIFIFITLTSMSVWFVCLEIKSTKHKVTWG